MTLHNTFSAEQMSGIGDRIRFARERKGVDITELANRIGVTERTLKHWETGVSLPRANRLPVLAGTLSASMRWLMSGEGDVPEAAGEDSPPNQALLELLDDLRSIERFNSSAVNRLEQIERRLRLLALASSDDDDDAFI